jgi:hypothetical protein
MQWNFDAEGKPTFKEQHFMLDLETFGTELGSAIVAVGCCHFDPDADEIKDTFYEVFRLGSAVKEGATLDPAVVLWWMNQSPEARRELTHPTCNIVDGLLKFTDWLDGICDIRARCVWGNSPVFDNGMLGYCYRQVFRGMEPVPWMYWNDRCYRTRKADWRSIEPDERDPTKHHNALDDAIYQANHLLKIARVLRERKAAKAKAKQ